MKRMKRTGARTVLTVSYLAVAVSALPACSDLPDLPNGSAARAGAPAEQRTGSPPQSKAKGRLFQAQDLGLLESPDRDEWEKPEQIMDAIGVAEGAVVAELGAAGGWFTLRLARRVGPNGLVYAEDIQPAMLEAIGRRVRNESLGNVKPVLGTVTDPRLPAGIDAILISDAFHEMDDPADRSIIVALLRNVGNALKPQGRLGIVDWTPGGGGPGPAADQRVDAGVIVRAAKAAGLQLLSREDYPPFIYLLLFGRASERSE